MNTPTRALVRSLPKSFVHALKQQAPDTPIDWALAYKQHEAYVTTLKSLIPEVLELPASEALPDCCFIEDTAVVIGNRAAINLLGAPERRGEEETVRSALSDLKIQSVNLTPLATLDGGDVLFTGSDIFVGRTKRTNALGAAQLTKIFPEFPTHEIEVDQGLHLKSVISAYNAKTLLVSDCSMGRSVAKQMTRLLGDRYAFIFLPDAVAANVLRIGEHLVIQNAFPKSESILRSLAAADRVKIISLNMSEFIKADGALTCCSILIST